MSHVWVPVCVCASVPTCLVGVRTVHHDMRFWRGCSVLRHICVNGFFLAEENTIFIFCAEIGRATATAETEKAPNQIGVQNRKYTHRYGKRGMVIPPPAGASARWVYGGSPAWLSSALCRGLQHRCLHGTSQSPRYGQYWCRQKKQKERESTLGGQRMGTMADKGTIQILTYSEKYEKRQDQMREEGK